MASETAAENSSTNDRPSLADVWSRDRLTGKSVSFKGVPPESETSNGGSQRGSMSPKKRKSKLKLDMKIDPMLWGVPGHLTEEEADVYVSRGYCRQRPSPSTA